MKFAKYVYYVAAVYGIIALLPQYFLLDKIGRDQPPAITHPEFFYGFIGCALVFQFVFLLMAREPLKYRALMPLSILEKLVFGVPCVILFLQNRLAPPMLLAGAIDLTLAALFFAAYLKTDDARI